MGESLPEIAAASAAMPLGHLQLEKAGAQSPVLVVEVAAFVSERGGAAVRARDGPCSAPLFDQQPTQSIALPHP